MGLVEESEAERETRAPVGKGFVMRLTVCLVFVTTLAFVGCHPFETLEDPFADMSLDAEGESQSGDVQGDVETDIPPSDVTADDLDATQEAAEVDVDMPEEVDAVDPVDASDANDAADEMEAELPDGPPTVVVTTSGDARRFHPNALEAVVTGDIDTFAWTITSASTNARLLIEAPAIPSTTFTTPNVEGTSFTLRAEACNIFGCASDEGAFVVIERTDVLYISASAVSPFYGTAEQPFLTFAEGVAAANARFGEVNGPTEVLLKVAEGDYSEVVDMPAYTHVEASLDGTTWLQRGQTRLLGAMRFVHTALPMTHSQVSRLDVVKQTAGVYPMKLSYGRVVLMFVNLLQGTSEHAEGLHAENESDVVVRNMEVEIGNAASGSAAVLGISLQNSKLDALGLVIRDVSTGVSPGSMVGLMADGAEVSLGTFVESGAGLVVPSQILLASIEASRGAMDEMVGISARGTSTLQLGTQTVLSVGGGSRAAVGVEVIGDPFVLGATFDAEGVTIDVGAVEASGTNTASVGLRLADATSTLNNVEIRSGVAESGRSVGLDCLRCGVALTGCNLNVNRANEGFGLLLEAPKQAHLYATHVNDGAQTGLGVGCVEASSCTGISVIGGAPQTRTPNDPTPGTLSCCDPSQHTVIVMDSVVFGGEATNRSTALELTDGVTTAIACVESSHLHGGSASRTTSPHLPATLGISAVGGDLTVQNSTIYGGESISSRGVSATGGRQSLANNYLHGGGSGLQTAVGLELKQPESSWVYNNLIQGGPATNNIAIALQDSTNSAVDLQNNGLVNQGSTILGRNCDVGTLLNCVWADPMDASAFGSNFQANNCGTDGNEAAENSFHLIQGTACDMAGLNFNNLLCTTPCAAGCYPTCACDHACSVPQRDKDGETRGTYDLTSQCTLLNPGADTTYGVGPDYLQ